MEIYQIKDDPSPAEIAQELTLLSNNMARLQRLVATYKQNVAFKKTGLKRAQALAIIKYRFEKNQALIRARVDIDDDVMAKESELAEADNVFTLAQAELSGYESQFIAIRKQASLIQEQMKGELND